MNIFCLSFPETERWSRMKLRFEALGLDALFFIPVDPNNPLIDYYLRHRSELLSKDGRRSASHTISYMGMLRRFIISGEDYAVFCEDDVHLKRTFKADIFTVRNYLSSKGIDFMLLGYLCEDFLNFEDNSETTLGDYKIFSNYSNKLWGSQMMILSRKYAMDFLEKYDKPFVEGSIFGIDWTLTKPEKRFLLYPMMAVEEGNVTTDHEGQIRFHKKCHEFNYSKDKYL